MLLVVLLLCAAGQIVPPSKQLAPESQTFEGFLYPYVMTSRRSNETTSELVFTRLDHSRLLFQPQDVQTLLEANYDLLPELTVMTLENMRDISLVLTESIVQVRDSSNPSRATQVLLRNPHLYLHLAETMPSVDMNNFIGMFQQRDEHSNKLPNRELHNQDKLFAVEELWREFIYVHLFREDAHFTLFLKRNIIHNNHYVEPYRFISSYYFTGRITGMRLVKSTVRDVLHIVLNDADRFCVFSTNKDLELQFEYCIDEKELGADKGLLGMPYDGLVFLRKSLKESTNTNTPVTIVNHFVVYHIELMQPVAPTCIHEETDPVLYFGVTGDYIALCTDKLCKLVDQYCTLAGNTLSFSNKELINDIQLVRYNITTDQFISQLFIRTVSTTFRFCQCLGDETTEEVKDINGNSEFLCKKPAGLADSNNSSIISCPKGETLEQVKDKKGKSELVCRKKEPPVASSAPTANQQILVSSEETGSVHFVPPILNDKCSLLNCFQCSMTAHCYFIDQQCKLIVGRPPVLYPREVYQQTNQFQELYSRYLYGQTSSCPDDTLYCTFNKSSIASVVRMVKYRSPPIAGQYCTVFVPLEMESRYRFSYTTPEHNFNVSLCENGLHDSPYGCFQRNTSSLQQFEMRGIKYLMLYLFYYGNLTTLQDSQHQLQGQHQLQEDYLLINIEQEEIYNATRLFTIVFGTFLLITIIFIAYVLLKSRLMARLALWGVVTFVPSGVYPLTKVELKLKLRELMKKGFLLEYRYELRENGKEEARTIEECSFCLEEFQHDAAIFELYCRHKYHKVCLSDWIRKERNSQKCPICKRGFTEAELIRFNEGSYSYGFNQEAAAL